MFTCLPSPHGPGSILIVESPPSVQLQCLSLPAMPPSVRPLALYFHSTPPRSLQTPPHLYTFIYIYWASPLSDTFVQTPHIQVFTHNAIVDLALVEYTWWRTGKLFGIIQNCPCEFVLCGDGTPHHQSVKLAPLPTGLPGPPTKTWLKLDLYFYK